MARGRLFDVAIMAHPTKAAEDNGAASELVSGPTAIVAIDAQDAERLALFALPKAKQTIQGLEVLVRPFRA